MFQTALQVSEERGAEQRRELEARLAETESRLQQSLVRDAGRSLDP